MKKRLGWAIAALLLALVLRGVLEGRTSLRRSDELAAQGDLPGAIAQAMHAARWYVPFAPHVAAAYDRLRAIAVQAELDGDTETALLAWQAIRASAYGTRSFYTPFSERLAEANDHLATSLATHPVGGADREMPRDALVRLHRETYANDIGASPLAIVLLYAGVAAWLVGGWRALLEVEAGLRDPGKASRWAERGRRAWMNGGVALAGAVAMVSSLVRG